MRRDDDPRPRPGRPGESTPSADDPSPDADAVRIPITDVLDLHPFRPQEVADVVRDYLDAAWDEGYRRVRLIHGKGIGVQRRTVRTLLERDGRVKAFGDDTGRGGWGATWVEME